MPRIVAVGWANLDHRFWIPHFPPASGRTDAFEYRSDIGGPAAVGALTIANLGGEVAFLGRRGNDEEGLRIKEILEAAGVDTSGFRMFHEGRTPVNTVLIPPDGERYIFRFMGDALTESADWIPESMVDGVQGILIDVRWPEGALRVAAVGRRLKIPVIVDWDRATPATWNLVGYATHVIADEEVASILGGPRSLLDRLKRHGVWGAVTLGQRGVLTETGWTPAFRVPARDTTGAGDVFHGAFALAMAEGRREEESVRYASAAAASRCALGEVPHQEHIDRILLGLPLTEERPRHEEGTRGI